MRRLRAGDLRTRVRLVAPPDPAAAQDTYGEPTGAPKVLGEMWAEVIGLTGREFFAARQAQADTTHRVRIRYRKDVTPACWFLVGPDWKRQLNITDASDPDQRRWELVCMCKEAV